MTRFEEAVLRVIVSLESGEVLTYGEVAAEAGYPGAARAVGNLLRRCDEDIPWWRVVGAGGLIRTPDRVAQAERLRSEGVPVVGGKVVTPPTATEEAPFHTPVCTHQQRDP